MKKILVCASLLLLSAAILYADDFHRELSTSGAPHVSVKTGSGYIHFETTNDTTVRITGHVHASNSMWNRNGSKDRIAAVVNHPPIEQSGNEIVIGKTEERNISIDYDIALPGRSSVEAHTGSGDIRGGRFDGPVAVYAGSGDIDITGAKGSLRMESGSGSLRARDVSGSAQLRGGSGDVELTQTAPGDVRAETGSGSLRLHGIVGSLQARTGSGDIQIQGQARGDWRVATGSGSVRLDLGPKAGFYVDASTGSGTIRIAQLNANRQKDRFSGTANGGGATLRLNTGSGDIEIH